MKMHAFVVTAVVVFAVAAFPNRAFASTDSQKDVVVVKPGRRPSPWRRRRAPRKARWGSRSATSSPA